MAYADETGETHSQEAAEDEPREAAAECEDVDPYQDLPAFCFLSMRMLAFEIGVPLRVPGIVWPARSQGKRDNPQYDPYSRPW